MAKLKTIVLFVMVGLVPLPVLASPAAEAKETEELYSIKPGDTLWGISSKFLKDPYLWPKLWERNPYITNPHWIYPGRPIRISPRETPAVEPPLRAGVEEKRDALEGESHVKTVQPLNGEAAQTEQRTGPLPEVRLIPMKPIEEKRFTVPEIRSSGFVGGFNYTGIGAIVDNKTGKLLLSESDIVYLAFKTREAVSIGGKYTIFRPSEVVVNPVTGQRIGRRYNITGNLQIIDANQGFYTGKITEAFEEVRTGDMVEAYCKERMEVEAAR
jgi:hypothetical protein